MEKHRDNDPRWGRESLGGCTEESHEMAARTAHWWLLKWWSSTCKLRQGEWNSQEKTHQAQGPAHLQPSDTVTRSHMLRGDRQLSRIPQNAAPADSFQGKDEPLYSGIPPDIWE